MRRLLLLLITFIIIVICLSWRSPHSDNGRSLFQENCVRCHGEDGTKGLLGARNLRKSRITDSAIIYRISNGKRFMPAFKKRLNSEDILQLAAYIKTLRQ